MTCARCRRTTEPARSSVSTAAHPSSLACTACGRRAVPVSALLSGVRAPDRLAAEPPEADGARSPRFYTPSHLAETILISRAALEGERKQVTVLFADLKSSMELLADRDPEEARRILDPVLELMMEAVHHYEGTVNQVMGDGIMALFGAPLAYEDHAVRACFAALRMQDHVRRHAAAIRDSHGIVDPDPRRTQLGRGRGAVRRQRPPDGLHGSRADHPPGRAHGADGRARIHPRHRRHHPARRRLRPGDVSRSGSHPRARNGGRGLHHHGPRDGAIIAGRGGVARSDPLRGPRSGAGPAGHGPAVGRSGSGSGRGSRGRARCRQVAALPRVHATGAHAGMARAQDGRRLLWQDHRLWTGDRPAARVFRGR